MSKTNSNSMTGILINALNNQESQFRNKILSELGKKVPKEAVFYDGTHSPLLYPEMNRNEIDIVARIPGKHKPVLMIEVKVNQNENLQPSQNANGEYKKTAEKHEIPLVYIIPKNYTHKASIPKIAKIIEWEKILFLAASNRELDFANQIENFVEISSMDTILEKNEIALLSLPNLLQEMKTVKDNTLKVIEEVLKKNKRVYHPEENQYGAGFYYNYMGNELFIGFNPAAENENFFALDIPETEKNIEFENDLYFEEGWYYVPVLNNNSIAGDEKILKEVRIKLIERKISFPAYFERSLAAYYTLSEKLSSLSAECGCDDYFADDNWFSFCENPEWYLSSEFKEFLFSNSVPDQKKAFKKWMKSMR